MNNLPICSKCGEDENFTWLSSNATNKWYKCENCGNENVTVDNRK